MFGEILGGLLGGLGGLLGGGATRKAAKQNDLLLQSLLKKGTGYIDKSDADARGYLGDARDLFASLAGESGGLSGLNLLGDALGVNGDAGSGRAREAFQTGPGYEFALDQGLDALERRASAQGRLTSGQTGLDTINYAHGLADQEYQNWLGNLSGYGGQQAGVYTGAIGGKAGALSDLANLAVGTGDRRTDLLGNVTNGLMGVNNQLAEGKQQQLGGLAGLGKGLGAAFGGYL